MQIEIIKECFENDKVLYSGHAKYEMETEENGEIYDHEVLECVLNGKIIKKYSDDKPYPSCLIFGLTEYGRPLHIVCAYNHKEKMVIVITVYQPDPNLWVEFKRRIKT